MHHITRHTGTSQRLLMRGRRTSANHRSDIAVDCNAVLTNGKASVATTRQLVRMRTLNPDQRAGCTSAALNACRRLACASNKVGAAAALHGEYAAEGGLFGW